MGLPTSKTCDRSDQKDQTGDDVRNTNRAGLEVSQVPDLRLLQERRAKMAVQETRGLQAVPETDVWRKISVERATTICNAGTAL